MAERSKRAERLDYPAAVASANPVPPKASRGSTKRPLRLDQDIEDVLVAATDVGRAIDRILRNIWTRKDLSIRGLYILYIIDRGFNRPSMLIKYFDVLPSTITVEIEKLASAGLLTRRAVPTDRRVTELVLTKKGDAVRREAMALLNDTLRHRLDLASPEELRICVETLRKIVQPLEPATPRDPRSEGRS
jgi:DNA-binding MarR family transcriptional regulator